MRKLLVIVAVLAIAGTAVAKDPGESAPDLPRVACDMPGYVYDWDFSVSNHNFTTTTCDAQGAPVWQHGATGYIPSPPAAVWGTILNGDYPSDAGHALVAPAFTVASNAYLVEVRHYMNSENNYDGGNVKANDALISPIGGYTGILNTSGSYYAWCVDNESAWYGNLGWRVDCFDLTPLMGQSVTLKFEFGTDSSVTYPGWYIHYVRVGGEGQPNPVEDASWGSIKSIYR